MVGSVFRSPYPVVLASASPRREELLRELIEDFEVVVPDIDEEDGGARDPWRLAERLAIDKAQAVSALRPEGS
jgi:septum formation protein